MSEDPDLEFQTGDSRYLNEVNITIWDHCLKGKSCMSFSHKEIPLIDQFVKAFVSLENLNRFR